MDVPLIFLSLVFLTYSKKKKKKNPKNFSWVFCLKVSFYCIYKSPCCILSHCSSLIDFSLTSLPLLMGSWGWPWEGGMPKVDGVPLGGLILDPCPDRASCREELFISPALSKVLAHGCWLVDDPSYYYGFMRARSHKCSQAHMFCLLSMQTIKYVSIMRGIRRIDLNLFNNFF